MTNPSPHPPRRSVLLTGAGLTAAAGLATLAVPAPASAATPAAAPAPRPRPVAVGPNGWPLESATDASGTVWTRQVPGSSVAVALRLGEPAVVLVHVIRRYHYEIDTLTDGEVIGFRPPGRSLKGYAANHASGTACAIRPTWYPEGVTGGLFPHQRAVILDILRECEDVVAWGGNFRRRLNEAHFQIDVPPSDPRLQRLAARLRGWEDVPGKGAGTLHLGV
ncbi:hypothetical protein ACF05T_33840 [Streptomyces lateritius]|uniref:Peptidase M15C domain-containing protein n=1 Tax=Streptomyces lateritius TaxID=67313 RepID=A0ABW6YM71_9ACTN